MTNDYKAILNLDEPYCSKVFESTQEKVELFNAINGRANSFEELVGKTVTLDFIYIETYNFVDETGKTDVGTKLIIKANGELYCSKGTGPYNGLVQIVKTFGDPAEWMKELDIKFEKIKTRRSYSLVTMLPVFRA